MYSVEVDTATPRCKESRLPMKCVYGQACMGLPVRVWTFVADYVGLVLKQGGWIINTALHAEIAIQIVPLRIIQMLVRWANGCAGVFKYLVAGFVFKTQVRCQAFCFLNGIGIGHFKVVGCGHGTHIFNNYVHQVAPSGAHYLIRTK